MPKKHTASKKPLFLRVISHKYFFWGIVALFILQGLWIALSAYYPMLFDEQYHVNVIAIYSHQLTPFIAHQPPEAGLYGDITRNSSYLFQYLMSFPYRFTSLFTDSLTAHIIVLRIICVLFWAGGIVVFNKLLRLAKVSASIRHIIILIFTLIPLVPFTAANVNYDSLVFLLFPTMLYMALKGLQKGKRQILWMVGALTTGAFACLVKFSVLPILLAVAVFIAIGLYRQYRGQIVPKLWKQLKSAPIWLSTVVFAFAFLAAGLFVERYGVNLALYHRLEPACRQLHPKKQCAQYTVINRDYEWKKRFQENPHPLLSPPIYTVGYFIPHTFNDFFVTAAYTGGKVALYQPIGKLEGSGGNAFLRFTSWAIFIVSFILVVATWRRVKYRQLRYLFLVVGLTYVVALWIKIYSSYLELGTPVAAQGRYMIPLLIPIFTIVALAINQVVHRVKIKITLCVLALLVLTQGGGVMTYIVYSKPSWYWHNQTVIKINQNTRQFLKHFI